MGLTRVTAKVSNLSKTKRGFEADFLVDTGAIDCIAPANKLKKAGIRVEGRAAYELANGKAEEYNYGFARITFMGYETVAQIVFAPDDTEPILGVVALENAGIGVDQVTRTLKKMPARPLK